MIDLKLSVCYDEASKCILEVPVFIKQRLPKNSCDFARKSTSKTLFFVVDLS